MRLRLLALLTGNILSIYKVHPCEQGVPSGERSVNRGGPHALLARRRGRSAKVHVGWRNATG